MAATGFTPISLYYSTTASAVPTAGNLANGELALNIADMKLYAKNSAGTVTLLASNSSTGATVSSVSGTGTVSGITLSGTVTSSGSLTLGGTLSLVSPPPIGSSTPNTGAFTTISATGAITAATAISAITSGGTNDPYGVISVSGAANTNNYSFFGLTRNGNVGAAIGITGTTGTLGLGPNAFWFGGSTASGAAGGVLAGSAYVAFNSSSFVTVGGATFNGNVNAASGTGNTTITATNTTSALQLQSNSQDGYLNMTGTGYIYLRFGSGSNLKFTFGPSGQFGVNGSDFGTAGQVLTSAGSGSAPTWASASGGTTMLFCAFSTVGSDWYGSGGI